MATDPDCIFCKIVDGSIPSSKVYEDDHTFAFLDINPLSRGHTLLVPRAHYAALEDMPAKEVSAYIAPLPRLLAAVTDAAGADGATVAWNNGRAAGQEVAHVHLHLVPRFEGDDAGPVHGMFRKRPSMAPDEIADLAERVKKGLE